MSKIIIDDLLDVTSFLSDANQRFQQIADEFNTKVLYRNNPANEPNGMFNDLDMQENDVLNVSKLDTQTLTLGGVDFGDGINLEVAWGKIVPQDPVNGPYTLMAQQRDLDSRFVKLEQGSLNTIEISDTQPNIFTLPSNLGLSVEQTGTNAVIALTSATNVLPGGIVQVGITGKIPNSLLTLTPTSFQGYFRGDDACPKDIDSILGDPSQCVPGLDYRNPDEVFASHGGQSKIFEAGDYYTLNFIDPLNETGFINLRAELDPTGPYVQTAVNKGDGILYLEDSFTEEGTQLVLAGWFLWAKSSLTQDASAVNVDTLNFGRFFNSGTTTVQIALDKIDDDVGSLVNTNVYQQLNTFQNGVTINTAGTFLCDRPATLAKAVTIDGALTVNATATLNGAVTTNNPITIGGTPTAGSDSATVNTVSNAIVTHEAKPKTEPTSHLGLDDRIKTLEAGVGVLPQVPIGCIMPWAAPDTELPPNGWLLCDGNEYAAPELQALLGNLYGAPVTNGNVITPDLQVRMPIGTGALTGTTIVTGVPGGVVEKPISTAELPTHTHTVTPHTHNMFSESSGNDGGLGVTSPVSQGSSTSSNNDYSMRTTGAALTASVGITSESSEVSIDPSPPATVHNIMQPYLGMRYIIKSAEPS